jgi:hypothetical protein
MYGKPEGGFRGKKHHKPRLSLDNNTAGVCEREDVNRTREAGNRDEVERVVASTLRLHRNGAVGFIVRLCNKSSVIKKYVQIGY